MVLINLSAPVFQQRATLQLWCPGGRGKVEVALLHKQLRFRDLESIKAASDDFDYYMRPEWNENSTVAELFDQKAKTLRYRYSFITNQRRYELNPLKDSNEYYLLFGMKTDCRAKPRLMVTLLAVQRLYP